VIYNATMIADATIVFDGHVIADATMVLGQHHDNLGDRRRRSGNATLRPVPACLQMRTDSSRLTFYSAGR
jgi:hypothetical protein